MEMVSAKALTYKNKKTEDMLVIHKDEAPVSLQIFGSEPEVMAKAVQMIEEREYNQKLASLKSPIRSQYDIVDINMGCPVSKIVSNGEGSALMKNPKLIGEIVKAVSSSTKKPVTVKIRKGFDEEHVNAVQIAKIAEDNGAAAVAVHGRTREQFYSGKADWEIIRQVKDAVKIPVIGNGDIIDVTSAKKMQSETGCDFVMVARGAMGNPWIFRELVEYDKNGIIPERPTHEELIEMMLRHARLLIEYKGEHIGIREMRKHVAWYTKGLTGSARLRDLINHVENYEELVSIVRCV
jgi:nifR3 family TIM-barrel protein